MRRMNRSRVNLKHHGSIPSAMDVEQFRADVTTFLTDATQMVFAADFHSFDMIDLVTQESALALLGDAEAHAGQGDYTEALALLSEALDGLLKDYADRKRAVDGFSPFPAAPPPPRFMGVLPGHDHDPELVDQIDKLTGALERMQRAVSVLAMGLDYRRYARFELLVPHISYLSQSRQVRLARGLQVGDEEYQFCKHFVIETALHLAEMDFNLDLRSLWWEHRRQQRELAEGSGTNEA
jgi:hypothetical protein